MLPKLKHVNVKNEFYNIWRVENLNYITHIHEELEMVYISQGQLEVTIEDTEYLLRAGDICLYQFGHNDQKLPTANVL